MGEGQDSVHIRPTAEKEKNSLLDDSFFQISRETPEGLSSIPEKTLEDFAYTRNDIDDILYVFKFISNEEYFFDIASNEATDFIDLSIEEQEKVTKLANLFYGVLTESPEFHEISQINVNETGEMIACIYERFPQLHVAWKKKTEEKNLMGSLIEKAREKEENYPVKLRSFANIFIEIDADGVVNITFLGDEGQNRYYPYAPGYLRNFEEELREMFKKHFPGEDLKFIF